MIYTPEETVIELSKEQMEAVAKGEVVPLTIAGQDCVLVRKEAYERLREEAEEFDTSPWTVEEMNLLADEAERIITQSEQAHERQPR